MAALSPARLTELDGAACDQLRIHGYTGTFTACTCELCDLARGVLALLSEVRALRESASALVQVAREQADSLHSEQCCCVGPCRIYYDNAILSVEAMLSPSSPAKEPKS